MYGYLFYRKHCTCYSLLFYKEVLLEPYCGEKPNDSHPDFYQMQIPKTPGILGLQYGMSFLSRIHLSVVNLYEKTGGVLGPLLLFVIFINDMDEAVQQINIVIKFADGTPSWERQL
jgi:hypothetical protein